MRATICKDVEDHRLEFAVILARHSGKLVLCRHRDRTTWEFPGGHREAGEGIAEAAARELREETGATAEEWTPLGSLIASPGCYDEVLYLFLARGLHFGDTDPDEDEFLSLERIPLEKLVQRCMSGEITDAKTVCAALKAKILQL